MKGIGMGGILLAGNLIPYMWYNKFVMMPILLVFKLVGLVLTLMWSKHIFLQKKSIYYFCCCRKSFICSIHLSHFENK